MGKRWPGSRAPLRKEDRPSVMSHNTELGTQEILSVGYGADGPCGPGRDPRVVMGSWPFTGPEQLETRPIFEPPKRSSECGPADVCFCFCSWKQAGFSFIIPLLSETPPQGISISSHLFPVGEDSLWNPEIGDLQAGRHVLVTGYCPFFRPLVPLPPPLSFSDFHLLQSLVPRLL